MKRTWNAIGLAALVASMICLGGCGESAPEEVPATPDYSQRSVTAGSIRVARKAGTRQAKIAEPASNETTAT